MSLAMITAAGCAQPVQRHPMPPWPGLLDAIWSAIEKHESVWVDRMEFTEGRQIESKLKALNPAAPVTGASYGIILGCHVAGIDVQAMTAFRRELKNDPTVSRYFPVMNFDVQWSVTERKDTKEKYSLDFEVILVNTGQT